VKLLLKHGALVNRHIPPNKSNSFRLYHDREYHKSEWFRKGHLESLLHACLYYKTNQGPNMFRLLLDNGEDPQSGRGKSSAQLNSLCAGNLWVYAEPLIHAGANVRGRDGKGYTAMYWAANCNNVMMINLLLEKGADINAQLEMSAGGYTPLHIAVICNRFEAARALIKKGADIQLIDAMGLTALQHAANRGDSRQHIGNLIREAMEERSAA